MRTLGCRWRLGGSLLGLLLIAGCSGGDNNPVDGPTIVDQGASPLDLAAVDTPIEGSPDLRADALAPADAAPADDLAAVDLPAADSASEDLAPEDLAAPDLATPDLGAPDLARADLTMPDLAASDLTGLDLRPPRDLRPAPDLRSVDLAARPADLATPPADLAMPPAPDLASRDLAIGPPVPVTGHPRLWVTQADLPALRQKAVDQNPLFKDSLMNEALKGKTLMDAGKLPGAGADCQDQGPCEDWAKLFAFVSLVHPDPATRADYARRAKTLLFAVINVAKLGAAPNVPLRDPTFSARDRSRWSGDGFGLTVDWIYPTLTAQEKADIRTVFLRWCGELQQAATTSFNHPEPAGLINDPVLLKDRLRVRWAGNNYFAAHGRNMILFALALDPADDAGGKLRAYADIAVGSWLYMMDDLFRTDAASGFAPEGSEYGPQTYSYFMQMHWALQTAGYNDPALRGRQAWLPGHPLYRDAIPGLLHLLSPKKLPLNYPGDWHAPMLYGDSPFYQASTLITGDPAAMLVPLARYAESLGDTQTADAARWVQINVPPGGASRLVARAAIGLNAILYFILFPPNIGSPPDPKAKLATDFYSPGLGIQVARTSWNADATWFQFQAGWQVIDHQHGDAGNFGLWRKGEWLTKEQVGWEQVPYALSHVHNTLSIQNGIPLHNYEWRGEIAKTGSQYLYVSGDAKVVARSVTAEYVSATGDLTAAYNSAYEAVSDVKHASRSILWLKPDHVVTYDRATTGQVRFKRLWQHFPAMPAVNGQRATVNTPGGQKVYFTTLLPAGARITPSALGGVRVNGDAAAARLAVEPPADVTDTRFLTVLEGADGAAAASAATLVTSSAGTAYEGAVVGGRFAVLFPKSLGAFASTTFEVPMTVQRLYVTGLTPGAAYTATKKNLVNTVEVAVVPGGAIKADAGGVIAF